MTDWPQIIRDVMKEKKISIRRLAINSGIARSSLKRFLKKTNKNMRIDNFERLLPVLGLELVLIDPLHCAREG